MIRRFGGAFRLIVRVQLRSYFPHVYVVLAIVSGVAFRWLIPEELVGLLLPAVLFGEQGIVAYYLVAAYRSLEDIEGSTTALAVTPLHTGEYLSALVVATAAIATPAGCVLWAVVLGLDGRTLVLVLPLFLTAVFAGLLGCVFWAFHRNFTGFLLGSIPVVTLLSLPNLSYFGLIPRVATRWHPLDLALRDFANLARPEPDPWLTAANVVLLALFNALAYTLAHRSMTANRRRGLEFA